MDRLEAELGVKVEIRPHGSHVLIRPDASATETAGGLIIPDTCQERPPSGHLLVVGPGPRTTEGRATIPLLPGDRVLFNKNSGWRFRRDGARLSLVRLNEPYDENDVLLIDVKDIICVVNDAPEEEA